MSNAMILSGLNIYTEKEVLQDASIEIAGGQIQSIPSQNHTTKTIKFPKNYSLVPGFIDLHIHGANGSDVMDGNKEALNAMSSALCREGVTGFLATTMTAPLTEIEAALSAVQNFTALNGAKILGVHLEGPFLSPEKVGAQNQEFLIPFDVNLISRWKSVIKMVTLAPELPGSSEFIRFLKQNKIVAALGHTNATFVEAEMAIGEGCSHVTHLFNAMRGIHQREPGIITSALLSDKVTTELIVDGHHVHPALVQLTLQLKGKDKLVLVTDAMRAKCLGDGSFDLGGQTVIVKNRVARLVDGTLAGSTLTMSEALKNLQQMTGFSLLDSIKMTSENPAKVLGIFNKTGSIAVGKQADLVVLDDKGNVVLTLVEGRIAYKSQLTDFEMSTTG